MTVTPVHTLHLGTPGPTPDQATIDILRALVGTWVHLEHRNGSVAEGTLAKVEQRNGTWYAHCEGWYLDIAGITLVRWMVATPKREAPMPDVAFDCDRDYTALRRLIEGADLTIALVGGERLDAHCLATDEGVAVVDPWNGEAFDAEQRRRIDLDLIESIVVR